MLTPSRPLPPARPSNLGPNQWLKALRLEIAPNFQTIGGSARLTTAGLNTFFLCSFPLKLPESHTSVNSLCHRLAELDCQDKKRIMRYLRYCGLPIPVTVMPEVTRGEMS